MAAEKVGDGISEYEMYELKKAAVKYYTENGVTDKMEAVLNSMFFLNPDDVYGHLSNYFAEYSTTPTISRLSGHEAYDSRGEPALQISLYGKVKNAEKLLSTTVVSNPSQLVDAWKMEDKTLELSHRHESIVQAVAYTGEEITTKLAATDVYDQSGVDELLYAFVDDLRREKEDELAREAAASEAADVTPLPSTENKKPAKSPKGKKSAAPVVITPDPPAEVRVPGSELVSAVSMAVCTGAARLRDVPLHQYIKSLQAQEEESSASVRLPLPVVTVIQGGKSSPGKQNCVKEFMVTPCPEVTVSQGLKNIQTIQATVFEKLYAKAGASLRWVSELGAMVPVLDRPEQGLDLIQEAATQCELTAGTDYNIILNLAARDIFDYEKGRYEVVTGQLKLADELADFYADLVTRYPSVIGLIDPIRSVEKEAWYKLGEKISDKCFIFLDEGSESPGKYRQTLPFFEHFHASGTVFQYDDTVTVSHLIDCARIMKEKNQRLVLSTNQAETSDTFLVDLAVGIGADFLRIGGLNRGERVSKANRLLQIESELSATDGLDSTPAQLEFVPISVPEVPPTPEDGESSAPDQATSSDSK